ncbi:aminotransferase class V-fold PLP-dependent enzyme [Mangrovibacterium marinum]|uniref:Probable cysteine desulfurase n=1 Tax=Mangrovibacterium marinum TaxID=1639118 RepID=A0A2T5BYK2_9BACT|nr:cysteine desulfurase [Mangrovibacterium marinum]PTN07314.1 cysteine desulfurase/selenocysteine lyase [Mangrovibacterium marinum]
MTLDIARIRKDFPVLEQQVYNKPLIYLDSAASSQKPLAVLKKEEQLHLQYYGNIHRGAHYMADKATLDFEAVRDQVKAFIHAGYREEIIFTKGTTESINLVAFSFGEAFIHEGDEIIVSEMEHHANIVPWQMMAARKGAQVRVLPFDDAGRLMIEKLDELINEKTRLLAVCQVANTLGTVNPVQKIIEKAHARGVKVLVDGAQAVNHLPVDVVALDADFYAFSAHKMFGPNGVGVLYGKKELLDQMPPYQGGGEMISEVSFEATTYNELPYKFEAGTPNITGVIAFGEAIAYLENLGIAAIAEHEHRLLNYATEKLMEIPGMTIYGTQPDKSGVITFNVEGIHSFDLSTMLDKMGIAVRSGRLCADTVMQHYQVSGTIRISFGVYNTQDEIDQFIAALKKLVTMLS